MSHFLPDSVKAAANRLIDADRTLVNILFFDPTDSKDAMTVAPEARNSLVVV